MKEDQADAYLQEMLYEAEQIYRSGDLDGAVTKFVELIEHADLAPFCYYRIAEILNKKGDAFTAKDFYYRALFMKPDIFKRFLSKDHPNCNYIFRGKTEEIIQDRCPLCGSDAKAYWCYPIIEGASVAAQRCNPIRLWMHCSKCHHLFAEQFPKMQIEGNSNRNQNEEMDDTAIHATEPLLFPYYAKIISKLMKFTEGLEFLEIGLGGCECSLAAREIGYNVFGIDISEQLVIKARNSYGLNAEKHDFIEFETDRNWDIIIMGDVIEHMQDPVRAIEKAYEMLDDNGVLWISTPNFDSACALLLGHSDPMRREAGHINYFSRISLFNLLKKLHFRPVDYQISAHYKGSMEVIAIKES